MVGHDAFRGVRTLLDLVANGNLGEISAGGLSFPPRSPVNFGPPPGGVRGAGACVERLFVRVVTLGGGHAVTGIGRGPSGRPIGRGVANMVAGMR